MKKKGQITAWWRSPWTWKGMLTAQVSPDIVIFFLKKEKKVLTAYIPYTWHYPINHEGSFWVKWVLSLVKKSQRTAAGNRWRKAKWERYEKWGRKTTDRVDVSNVLKTKPQIKEILLVILLDLIVSVSHCLEHFHTVWPVIGRLWNPDSNHGGCFATFCNAVCTFCWWDYWPSCLMCVVHASKKQHYKIKLLIVYFFFSPFFSLIFLFWKQGFGPANR